MVQKEPIRLQIEVGTELLLEIEEIQGRFKCNLVGIKPDEYLITELSPSKINNNLLENKRVIARYLYFGNVYGFHSKILKAISQPYQLLFINYPESIEKINLRKKDRIQCYIPSKAKVLETEIKGVILDLSSDGCKFATNVTENNVSRFIKTEDEITLFFPLLGKEGLEKVRAIVKNIIEDDKKKIFGIQFEDLPKQTSLEIENYIESFKGFI